MDSITVHGKVLGEDSPEYLRRKAYDDLCRKTKRHWDKFHRIKAEFDKTWSPRQGVYSVCYWAACGGAWEELEAKCKPFREEYQRIIAELSPKQQELTPMTWFNKARKR